MGADVAVVECVGQSVLGDNVEIAAVEVRIPFVFLEALPEDHVGGNEAPRIGSTEDKAVLGEIDEHVMPVHPSKPVSALGTLWQRNDEGIDGGSHG